jgi:hypothetical protein
MSPIASAQNPPGCPYWWEGNTLVTTCDIVAVPTTYERPFAFQVYRPTSDASIGTVTKVLGRYDALGVYKAGATTDITNDYILSYSVDITYKWWPSSVTVKGLVLTSMYAQPGDSGSPVYIPGWLIGLSSCEIYAYAIVSGGGDHISVVSPLDAYHLYIRYTP